MTKRLTKDQFYGASEDVQISNLAQLAKKALIQYGMQDADISELAYRENMTFEIDAGRKGKFALRIHQAGYRTDAQVQSELDFMEYINSEGILTPNLVRTEAGESFITTEHASVPELRQCDLFKWIDGTPLRKSSEVPNMSVVGMSEAYSEVGRLTAGIYNASEKWTRPERFERLSWDVEGIIGDSAHLGDFRKVKSATDHQRGLLSDLADRLRNDLDSFGKTPDRFGLSQADLLPENLMVCSDGVRIIDFDDTGDNWIMFDVATAFCDLTNSEYFNPCLEGFVKGFRQLRPLPDEQLAMLPTFMMARLLSYLGHTASRDYLAQSKEMQAMLLAMLEDSIPSYLAS